MNNYEHLTDSVAKILTELEIDYTEGKAEELEQVFKVITDNRLIEDAENAIDELLEDLNRMGYLNFAKYLCDHYLPQDY